MTSAINYAFILLFQAFVLFIYLENALTRKKKTSTFIVVFWVTWAVSFAATFLWIPFLNLAVFMVMTFLITYLCYGAKIRSCLFHVFVLSFFMAATEFLVLYISSIFFDITLAAHRYDDMILFVQAALSKLLFFVAAYLAVKLRKKERNDLENIPILLVLSLIPLLSVIFLLFIWTLYYSDNQPIIQLGIATTIILLISNMIVFFIYELTRRTYTKNTQLQLEQQREKISTEHYELLFEKQENYRVLVHDIKRHLQGIQSMALQAQQPEIQHYAASLCEEFELNHVIAYSGNKFVDVIVSRYAQACKAKDIPFEVDVRGTSLDFMSDVDIMAILDNMLENALEATLRAAEQHISLTFYEQNESFVVIKTQNSCDHAPIAHQGKLVSSKKEKQAHGIGLKSIHRIAKKYNGNVKWYYYRESKTFEIMVVMEMPTVC